MADGAENKYPLEWQAGIDTSTRLDADSAKVVEKLNEINTKISKTEQEALKSILDNAKIATAQTKEQLQELVNASKVRESDAKAAAAEEKLRQQQIQTDIKASIQAQQEYKAAIQEIALENKRIAVEEIETAASRRKRVVSESTDAEVAAYNHPVKASQELIDFQQLSVYDQRVKAINADFEAGVISANQYSEAIKRLDANVAAAAAEPLRNYNQSIRANEAVATNAALQQQLGIKERLLFTEKDLKLAISTETDIAKLAALNLELQETQAQILRMTNIGKIGFDELGNKIVETEVKLTPFQASLARATNVSALAGRAVTSLTRQLVGLAVGLASFAIGEKAIEFLIDYVKNLDIFSGRLDQAKQNLAAFNEVDKAADADAGKKITNLKILYAAATDVENSTKARTAAARELQKEFPNEFANANSLAIVNGKLKATYDDLSKSILEQARASAAAAKIQALTSHQLDNQFQIDKNNLVKYNELSRVKGIISGGSAGTGAAGTVVTEDQQKQNIKAKTDNANLEATQNNKILQGQIDFLTKYVGGNDKLAEAVEKSTATADKKKLDADAKRAAAAAQKELDAKRKLLDQIADLEISYQTKSISKDDAEVKAVTDKYDKMRRSIEEFNAKVKDSKNKVSEVGLNASEGRAVETVMSNQSFQYYKDDLDKQKKIFDDFEGYKLKVGSEKAEQRFANELHGNKSFIDYLNNQLATTINPDDKSKATADRKALLEKDLSDEYLKQAENYTKLLESLKTYQTEYENLVATHADQVKLLQNNPDALRQENLQFQTSIDSLNDKNVESLDVFKKLFQGVKNLGVDAIKQIDIEAQSQLDALVKSGRISQDEVDKIKNAIDSNKDAIAKDLPKSLDESAKGLQEMAKAASLFNAELGATLGILATITSSIGGIAKGIKAFNDPKSTAADKIGAGLGIAGAVVSVAETVVSFFKAAKASRLEAEKQLDAYNTKVAIGQYDYNIQLRATKDLQADITKLTSQQLKDRIALLATSKSQSQSDYDSLLAQIQSSGQQITGTHIEKYGGFLGLGQKSKDVQDLAGLGSAGYDDLLKLYTGGKLTDATKTWFEELKKVHDEMATIGTDATAAKNQLDQISTGTTVDSIATSIVDGFKKGYKTAADFAGTFKDLMQQALLSTFEVDYLKPKIAEFYKSFAALSEKSGGLNQADIDALRAQYATIITNSAAQIGNITAITGPIGSTTANPNTLSGAISTASQASIDLLAGQLGGLRLAQLQSNDIETKILAVVSGSGGGIMQMVDTSLKMLDQLIMIQANTGITATFAPYLKTIAQNTYDNTSVALRAAGLTAIPTR